MKNAIQFFLNSHEFEMAADLTLAVLTGEERTDALLKIIKAEQRAGRHGNLRVVALLPEPQRSAMLKKFRREAIRTKWFERAKEIAKLLKRQLTQKELEQIFYLHEEPISRDIEIAALMCQPEREQRLNQVLENCIKYGNFILARQACEQMNRGLSLEETRRLRAAAIERGRIDRAIAAADALSEALTLTELERLWKRVKHQPWTAKEVIVHFPEPLKTRKIRELFRFCMDKEYVDDAFQTARLLPSPERERKLQMLFSSLLTHHFDIAVKVAKDLLHQKKLSREMAEKLLAACIKRQDCAVYDAARLLINVSLGGNGEIMESGIITPPELAG